MKQNFRFSGTGGQGLITAGIILAEAALLDGKLAVQSQSYGPEARGGSSKAEVIISDEPIRFGRVTHPDTLLVMSQEAADKFSGDCDGSSLIITDSLFVEEVRAKAGIKPEDVITCRPADLLEPELAKYSEEYAGIAQSTEDILSLALFPQVAPNFIKRRNLRTPPIPRQITPVAGREQERHIVPVSRG